MRRIKGRTDTLDAELLISPGEIIARAAATVPENDGAPEAVPHAERVQVWAPSRPLDGTDPAFEANAPAPMRRAQRRPSDVLRSAMFFGTRGAAIVAGLALIAGIPAWLWWSGTADRATRHAAATIHSLQREAVSRVAVRLDHLDVEGRTRTTQAALRGVLQLKKGDSLFAADPWLIKRRLETLPWVRSATVERRYPGTLTVRLVERNPVARYRDGGSVLLVDDTGMVIPVAPEKDHDSLILLTGAGASEASPALLTLLEDDTTLARRITAATRHGNRRWDLVFDSGAVLRLPEGYERAAWAKFVALDREHNFIARGAVSFDMRLLDRIVIRNPGRTPAPASAPRPPEKPNADAKKPKKTG